MCCVKGGEEGGEEEREISTQLSPVLKIRRLMRSCQNVSHLGDLPTWPVIVGLLPEVIIIPSLHQKFRKLPKTQSNSVFCA